MGRKRKGTSTAGGTKLGSSSGKPDHQSPATSGSTCSRPAKRRKCDTVVCRSADDPHVDRFACLSLEVICQILEYLPIWDIMKLECLNHRLQEAVSLHLRLLIDVDFTEGEIHGWMPIHFTDLSFSRFINRCPELMFIYGLHFHSLSRRRHRGSEVLSIPGIIEALQQLEHLQGVETSDIYLLEAILNYLPDVEIMGLFKNRDGRFPIPSHNPISLTRSAQIASLHLIGIEMRDLPRMDFLKRLHLKWVRFTDPHPFKNFNMPSLRTFVMNNCAGPPNALKYVSLMTGLVTARNLSRLELVRVPFLGGLIHHVVEDSWRVSGFRSLHRIMLGACKHAQEADLGYLMVTCAGKLEDLHIQPSLTKDSFFYSLTHAQVSFPKLSSLYLGYVDPFPQQGKWSQLELTEQGLSDYTENPAFLTDFGMKCVREVFGSLTSLTLYNCPHLHFPSSWLDLDMSGFNHVTDLHLRRCHAIRLPDFCRFLSLLPNLESLSLEQMFMEPPKGCSRVGLSAGTGLGVSSALVSDNGPEHPANQEPGYVPANPDPGNPLPGNANNNAGGAVNDAIADDEDHEEDFDEDDQDFDEDEDEEEEIVIKVELDKSPSDDRKQGNKEESSSSAGEVPGSNPTEKLSTSADENSKEKADNSAGDDVDSCETSECVVVDGVVWAEVDVPTSDMDGVGDDPADDPLPGPSSSVATAKQMSDPSKQSDNGSKSADKEADVAKVSEKNSSSQSGHSKVKSLKDDSVLNDDISVSCDTSSEENDCTNTSSPSTSKNKQAKSENTQPKGKSLWGRKKGIVKKPQIMPLRPTRVSRACQCSSEEIREVTKNSLSSGSSIVPVKPPSSDSTKSRSPSSAKQKSKKSERRVKSCRRSRVPQDYERPMMVDRSTSTSDPVIEDDHVQVLTLDCKQLLSVTLNHVGITDIVLRDCPKLLTLTGSACRVLKNVSISKAPKLCRVSFAQCPKLRHDDLVDEVCQQPPEKYRLIFLRPVNNYCAESMERQLFSTTLYKYHVGLVHDHSMDPGCTLYNRIRVAAWPDVISNINYGLVKNKEVPDAGKMDLHSNESPWRPHTFKANGLSSNGYAWDLVSDLPWIETLSRQPMQKNPSFVSTDSKDGVYSPSSKGHCDPTVVNQILADEITETKNKQRPLFIYPAIVYVNTCDLSGITFDTFI